MLRSLVLLTLPMTAIAADPTPQIRHEVQQLAERAGPGLLVVKVHADWCAGCRALGDIRQTLQPQLEGVSAEYLTFDVTGSEERARQQARALGIEPIFEHNRGRVGVVLVIDPATQTVLETFAAKDGAEHMRAGIRQLAARRG